jgi:peroxiredoxin/predicted 2-oxoglutarate/Fe(II)-dependent dioxygenase YbiX
MTTMQQRGLEPGDIAPNFSLADETGRAVELISDDVSGHFTVLVFFPHAISVLAKAQLQPFLDAAPKFAPYDVKMFGVGGETASANAAIRKSLAGGFSLLADPAGQYRAGIVGDMADDGATVVLAPNRHILAVIHGGDDQPDQALAAIARAATQRRHALVSNPHPPILIVPDVLSRADCQHLMNVFAAPETPFITLDHGAAMPAHDYKIRVPEYGRRDRIDHFIVNPATNALIHNRYQARLFPEIKKAYQYEVTRYEPYRIGCYEGERGGELHGHRDNTLPFVAHRRFAVSVNLNSEEFEGGELRFPEFGDETYRPPTGAAIAFSCSMLHEAMHVTAGRRLVLLAFLGGEH